VTNGAHRKVVTVLFCDVVGSTALGESVDPEALQALLARYFERMSGIVEAHGGTVEKFIGDAVMATDSPKLQGDAHCDLAEVLEPAGRREEAVAAWEDALSLYERKGAIPLARRVRERLASLQPA
jgi:class 3 adenylate cyclase